MKHPKCYYKKKSDQNPTPTKIITVYFVLNLMLLFALLAEMITLCCFSGNILDQNHIITLSVSLRSHWNAWHFQKPESTEGETVMELSFISVVVITLVRFVLIGKLVSLRIFFWIFLHLD